MTRTEKLSIASFCISLAALTAALWPDSTQTRLTELRTELAATKERAADAEQRAIRNSAFSMGLYRKLIDPTLEETGIERTAATIDRLTSAVDDANDALPRLSE